MRNTLKFNYEINIAPADSDRKDFSMIDEVDDLGKATQKYTPLRNITIVNNSGENARYYENESGSYELIPAGVIFTRTNRLIYRFRIQNMSAINDCALSIVIDNERSTEEIAEETNNLLKGRVERGL